MSPKICHFGVKYSNSVLNCLNFIIIPLVSWIQIKVLIDGLALLLDLFGNSEETKLFIWTVIFCLVFTAPPKLRVEFRAKIGHYRNRCFGIEIFNITFSDIKWLDIAVQIPKFDMPRMRGSRGGGVTDPPPPPEICQRWGLVWMLDGEERGSRGCFDLIIIKKNSGSLRSPV